MSKNVFNSTDRQQILDRFATLSPDRKPAWGRMSCIQMVAHCGDPLRAAMGEMEVRWAPSFLRFPPLRYAIIHWLPIPKGAAVAVIGRFGERGGKGVSDSGRTPL